MRRSRPIAGLDSRAGAVDWGAMSPQDRLHRALQKIGSARAAIIRTAAEWQAAGTETSPLTAPLIEIQEALSQLETLAASLPAPTPAAFSTSANTSLEPRTGT